MFNQPIKNSDSILTVSQLNFRVRSQLEEMGLLYLKGEISNFSNPASGHWYFTLKDSNAQIRVAMFRGQNIRTSFAPKNGDQVVARGRLSLYSPRGDYQFIIDQIQPEGEGQLKQEFERLKSLLNQEGLFAQEDKKPLPPHPKTIGIITSATGAALFDILHVLNRRDPSLNIIIYPCVVQGEQAPLMIAQTLGIACDRDECDVLILGRGGGSLEDLWAFNDEIVARVIYACHIPIISAVGHETDVSIADFVADFRAPTPSAAAELVSQESKYKHELLSQKKHHLYQVIQSYMHTYQVTLKQLSHRIQIKHPTHQLQLKAQYFDDLSMRLEQATKYTLEKNRQRMKTAISDFHPRLITHHLENKKNQMDHQQTLLKTQIQNTCNSKKSKWFTQIEKLEIVNPLSTLKRGYSVIQNDKGKLICDSKQVKEGEIIISKFHNGQIKSKVIK